VLGSLVPLVNVELLILSMAALAPDELLPPLVVVAAAGQMTGKTILYLAGLGTFRIARTRDHPRVKALLAWLESHRRIAGLILFASASAGVPPLYAMSVACGMLRFGLPPFLTVVLVGRVIRFSLLVHVPQLFMRVVQ
jgi:membrane protein YqaA with SNARE-associated domain